MVIKGSCVGFQLFQSGACQLFVATEPSTTEKVKEQGAVVRSLWQGKGTYSFDNPPNLVGATVTAFVGRNESGVLDIQMKGGEK